MKRSEAEKLLVRYSWAVLENKWKYYVGRGLSNKVKTVSDERYDKIEADYKKLCKALKIKPYSSDMVGFSFERGSTKLVHVKMCAQYSLDPATSMSCG